ncbi:MAG: chemotaxis-specific protein-glutamate methyltransferase CheB [Candidatus Schekmanbacteria bacterium]|nr:chemotaxis-specific protein-glutamate methyltransferase CheB [Candidatus Schekmanbacteria bacterium]
MDGASVGGDTPPAERRCRLLIADDSALVRRILAREFGKDPEFEIVAVAEDGGRAVALFAAVRPDALVLDVDMPGISGIEVLKRVRALERSVPVVMFSSYTRRGAVATVDALLEGANDYVAKPGLAESEAGTGGDVVRTELVPRVKALWRAYRAKERIARSGPNRETSQTVASGSSEWSPGRSPVAAVVIGSSTGGPQALVTVLARLPRSFTLPVFVAQHMPPLLCDQLAGRLAARSSLTVRAATHVECVQPGRVYLAPGNAHLSLGKTAEGVVETRLLAEPAIAGNLPSVDLLFSAASAAYGSGLLAVVLTGMGRDGVEGARIVRGRGGTVIVQDEESSVVWGMAGAVSRAGLATAVLPLERIAAALLKAVSPGNAPLNYADGA